VVQAHIFGDYFGIWGFKLFLFMAFLMLFAVMWTVIDAFTRIVSDIIYTHSHIGPYQKLFSWAKKTSLHQLYYGLITGLVFVGSFLLPLKEPLTLLVISSVLGGLAMAVYMPLIFYLNNFKLPKSLRPGTLTNLFLIFAFVFYSYFAIKIIYTNL
jgi:tetrahydromethanopterin S-methyltransferase subunit F